MLQHKHPVRFLQDPLKQKTGAISVNFLQDTCSRPVANFSVVSLAFLPHPISSSEFTASCAFFSGRLLDYVSGSFSAQPDTSCPPGRRGDKS